MLMGPSLDSFGTNKIMLAFLGLFALFALAVLISVFYRGPVDKFIMVFTLSMVIFSGTWLAWLLSVRVSFYQNGILYTSIFGKKEILWEDVEHYYYSVLKESVGFASDFAMPVGTYYSFKLKTTKGEKMAFGNRFERPADVGSRLIRATHAVLFPSALDLFNDGVELDFGPITQ